MAKTIAISPHAVNRAARALYNANDPIEALALLNAAYGRGHARTDMERATKIMNWILEEAGDILPEEENIVMLGPDQPEIAWDDDEGLSDGAIDTYLEEFDGDF